jgi:molybdopterin-binding protein
MLSARNQFKGTIKSIKLGSVMAEVVVAVGELEFVAAITRGSVEGMNLKAPAAIRPALPRAHRARASHVHG